MLLSDILWLQWWIETKGKSNTNVNCLSLAFISSLYFCYFFFRFYCIRYIWCFNSFRCWNLSLIFSSFDIFNLWDLIFGFVCWDHLFTHKVDNNTRNSQRNVVKISKQFINSQKISPNFIVFRLVWTSLSKRKDFIDKNSTIEFLLYFWFCS